MSESADANKQEAVRPSPHAASDGAPIATVAHFVGFLLIGAGIAALGFMAQHTSPARGAAPDQLASHGQALQVYCVAIVMDWALLYYCWAGVRRRGGTIGTLSGERWRSAADLLTDLAIAVPFWLLWEGTALGVHRLLGPDTAKAVDSLLPHTLVEVLVWTATCVTAGFCEELAFRGYVQRQLRAFSGSTALAVAGQGLVFGFCHLYQGWKNVIVIVVLGVLYGVLAAWRRNLRVNIITHAWSDFWEGWLKFLVWN
jgi:membrane protease YdiL (CAAX protease family)